jgi:transcriptional regulator with XRE-family HTH domain
MMTTAQAVHKGYLSQLRNSMAEKNWEVFRTYLKELLHDATVRKLIEQRTDISARTLARWVSGETEEPDRKRLTSLLQALPQYREPLLDAITRADPDFAVPLLDNTKSFVEDLPVDFWIRLAETNATTPRNLHFTAIVNLIFLQLQATIDPERLGIQLTLAQGSPPSAPTQPVRSLREIVKMKTHEPLLKSPDDYIFLGAESLCGYSVQTCSANIVQNTSEERRLPVRYIPGEQSAAAFPIQRGGYVAGSVLVSSPQPNFFSGRLQYLLQIYAYLLSMAFETEQFYAPERIHLRPMPDASIQHPYIENFQEQVIALLRRDASLSRNQAEKRVWQQIEETLLVHPANLHE